MKQRSAKPGMQAIAPERRMAREPSGSELQAWIAEAAYYRAERRGFEPGFETDDWLAAETEVLARVRGGSNLL